jgi:hypothetical protein
MTEIAKLLQSREDFYDTLTVQKDIEDLDKWRNEFPKELVNRYKEDSLYITKKELKKLMDWKLHKGKYRATLPKLIQQNDEKLVVQCSKSAFLTILKGKGKEDDPKEYIKTIKSSMATICQLRGVGPATGSLILSLLSEITHRAPPFFSDEAGMYVLTQLGEFKGKLKYNNAEYMKYLQWFVDLDPEMEHSKTLLEQGAWCEWLK